MGSVTSLPLWATNRGLFLAKLEGTEARGVLARGVLATCGGSCRCFPPAVREGASVETPRASRAVRASSSL